MKTALITGVTGQDGAVLAELLLEKGYSVHGLRSYSAVPDTARIEHLDDVVLHYGDMSDGGSLTRLIETIKPDEIYNMAGMSHVHVSFDMPELTADVNGLGPLRILDALRVLDTDKDIKFYQASSSEMFGRSPAPQSEETSFQPCSPYGTAKLHAYWSVRNYRDAHGLFASNGILFNHESAMRGEEFVTRKITKAIGEIEAGQRDKITLGNLDARRDWGHAKDYMAGAHAILQHDKADDFVLASGQSYSVRDFVERAFAVIDIQIEWQGEGVDEVGVNVKTGQTLIDIDPALFRPKEVHELIGDASKAKEILNWSPKISFDKLVEEMVQADRIEGKSPMMRAA
ncbi:MAG: GDP-mannose 4,6-dehydratase [Alphaproteobacteria bacterium]|nr:GDP-mannose 4,6-dehydratase [Alphaproteobacteria bacterium]